MEAKIWENQTNPFLLICGFVKVGIKSEPFGGGAGGGGPALALNPSNAVGILRG